MKRVRKTHRPVLDKDVMVARFRSSAILDALIPDRKDRWTGVLRRLEISPPPSITLKDFSFLHSPDRTLAALKEIGLIELSALEARLHFDDPYCLDAGAFLVLAEIWPQMTRIFRGGRMSRPIQKVLNATGVGRHNRMSLAAAERDEQFQAEGRHADVWAFPLQRRRPALSSQSSTVHLDPQTREEAADRFCDAVDEWLGVPEVNQELTGRGKARIGGIIGELLCNAERHSRAQSDDGDWSTTAFMVRRDEDGESLYRCYMAFLSVGRSISESMSDAAPDVRQRLGDYLRQHWASGVADDVLSTVFALQDTITCDPSAWAQRSGGTGLQDVLEFVDFLGGTSDPTPSTRVTIVSGGACIELRHPHLLGQRKAPNQPRLLWCNASNTSDLPPDPAIASSLSEHFAGTLVSVAFTLDPAYLATLVESNDDGDD
jgi:hypothetical protein